MLEPHASLRETYLHANTQRQPESGQNSSLSSFRKSFLFCSPSTGSHVSRPESPKRVVVECKGCREIILKGLRSRYLAASLTVWRPRI
jgi:hypothetical protein